MIWKGGARERAYDVLLFRRNKRTSEQSGLCSDVVPVVGLEPTRCRHRRILNPLRLPFHHTGLAFLLYHNLFRISSKSFLRRFAGRPESWTRAPAFFGAGAAQYGSQSFFQTAPPGTSVISIPCAFSSSRMRSASAKFLAFFAWPRARTSWSMAGSPSPVTV